MSLIIRCDRCGAEQGLGDEKSPAEVGWADLEDANDNSEEPHLCPQCVKAFYSFVNDFSRPAK